MYFFIYNNDEGALTLTFRESRFFEHDDGIRLNIEFEEDLVGTNNLGSKILQLRCDRFKFLDGDYDVNITSTGILPDVSARISQWSHRSILNLQYFVGLSDIEVSCNQNDH